MEKELDTVSANMLAAVGIKHGSDSSEYEMAGGTRASGRSGNQNRPTRRSSSSRR